MLQKGKFKLDISLGVLFLFFNCEDDQTPEQGHERAVESLSLDILKR